jgi:hypothetical protein
MFFKRLLLVLSFPFLLFARKANVHPEVEEVQGPWMTGPLLTPSGHIVPFGHQNFEPYIYWTDIRGRYDQHWHSHPISPHFKNLLSQTALQFGILPGVELDLLPQFIYNNSGGQHMWRVADLPVGLAFQIFMDDPNKWYPALKLRVGALIPLGKYDRLNPNKLGTDAGGGGNWAPTLGITSVHTYHFGGTHFFSWRMNVSYTFTVPISVHGPSFYGGAPPIKGITKGTRGTVYPGCILIIQKGFEYSLNLNWVLALDLMYQHSNRTRFSGHSPLGTKPIRPSAEQFSIAPAIEYNFNANIGIIAGPWFSIAGRNNNFTPQFISWILAINIYH